MTQKLKAMMFTTEWWIFCVQLTSGVKREKKASELLEKRLWSARVCAHFGMTYGMHYGKKIRANSGANMHFRNSQRTANSSCHSPGEKHSWVYSNNIGFHWEKGHIVQWCSKHGERNIITVKTSMLRHRSSCNRIPFKVKGVFGLSPETWQIHKQSR